MITINGINFDNTIRTLYHLKTAKGHKSLKETYAYMATEDIDVILDILLISFNTAHKDAPVNLEGLMDVFAENGIGFVKIATIYQQVSESLLLDGLSDEERKNLMAQASKK